MIYNGKTYKAYDANLIKAAYIPQEPLPSKRNRSFTEKSKYSGKAMLENDEKFIMVQRLRADGMALGKALEVCGLGAGAYRYRKDRL